MVRGAPDNRARFIGGSLRELLGVGAGKMRPTRRGLSHRVVRAFAEPRTGNSALRSYGRLSCGQGALVVMTFHRLLGLALLALAWLPLACAFAPAGRGLEFEPRVRDRFSSEAGYRAPSGPAPECADARLTRSPGWLAGRISSDAVAGGFPRLLRPFADIGFLARPPGPSALRGAWQFALRAAGLPRAPCPV